MKKYYTSLKIRKKIKDSIKRNSEELKNEIATKEDIIAYNNSLHWLKWVEAFSFLESIK